MLKNFSIIVFCFFVSISAIAKIDPYFSPSKDCEDGIISLIDNSKESVDIAIYAINNKAITKAIKKSYDREIKFRILADRQQATLKNSTVMELYDYGVNIRVHSKRKIQHNKYIIVDKTHVMNGSFNFTEAASNKNLENCLFFNRNKEATGKYIRNFENLWRTNSKKKSDAWFEKRKSQNVSTK